MKKHFLIQTWYYKYKGWEIYETRLRGEKIEWHGILFDSVTGEYKTTLECATVQELKRKIDAQNKLLKEAQ